MPHDDRLQRVEEAQAFLERTIEQLSAEIAAMNKRTAEMRARIGALESRIQKLAEPPDEPAQDD